MRRTRFVATGPPNEKPATADELVDLVLRLVDQALERVATIDVKMARPPGVVATLEGRTFLFAYQENASTFVYRETVMLVETPLPAERELLAATVKGREN